MLFKTGSKIVGVLLYLVLSSGLTGCTVASLVGANSEPPPATFDLQVKAHRGLGRFEAQIVINEAAAVEALSSARIAIKTGPHEISYFAAAAWTDKLPRLLQLRLVESFENSHIAKAVGTGDDRIRGDVGLSMEIRDFQVEVHKGVAQAHIRLFVKLVDEDRGQLLASREFSATTHASSDKASDGVEALNQSYDVVAKKLMRWIVKRRI
ncbi:MAG: ABC-type transport auxiliary lipoprotein family protein, partial [Hyphomicrobiaceae bacterium]|nr:ABC-type transport auxiliary lipoprotein family protein [Hyphomicrobiaceae bacterium]